MVVGTLYRGLLALVMAAFSCFPTSRGKVKSSGGKGADFQCVSCSIRKRNITIICGGGVTGLSSAYWLGRMRKSQQHSIVVLEASSQCFRGASGYNSGLLSCHWFSGGLRQLADHSFGMYQDLARKQPSFKETCDYHENSLFKAHCGEGPTDPRAPPWMNVTDEWHLESEPAMRAGQTKSCMSGFLPDDPSSATINPGGLGTWLYERCREYGVRIQTDCTLFEVRLCGCGKLRSVLVKSAQDVSEYECDDLVFAAGARTPRLVRELFPSFGPNFHETTNSGNWILVKGTTNVEYQMRAEVILDDIVDHQLEFVGRQNPTTHDFVIWVCGLNNEEIKAGSIDEQVEPDEDAITRLREYAIEFLWNDESVQRNGRPEVVDKGRTYRPTIDRDLPILTSVSCGELRQASTLKEQPYCGQRDCEKSGIWVCTGHGKYGITLGLGSALGFPS